MSRNLCVRRLGLATGLWMIGLLGSGCGSDSETSELAAVERLAGAARIFGDSIFTSGGGMIEQELERRTTLPIDSSAVSGTVMAQIRDQYRNSRGQGLKTAIMDGGGNDVLGARGDCQNRFTQNCRNIIDGAAAIAKEVFSLMAADGVVNVVHLSCHYPMGWNGGFDEAVDYGYTALAQACEESGANCIVVDPRAAFRGRSELLEWDGIHPNRGGAQTFANLILEGMQAAGMDL